MSTEIWQLINVIVVPVIVGIITWLWKLDVRQFELQGQVLKREEFLAEIRSIRDDLKRIRHHVEEGTD